mgnify:CR=1 FL=1
MIDFQVILNSIVEEAKSEKEKGTIANYIPELAKIDKDKFGISLLDSTGRIYMAGDASEQFSIQSISKVLSLSMAYTILLCGEPFFVCVLRCELRCSGG